MNAIQVLYHLGEPVAAYGSSSEAMRAAHELPGSYDPDLCLVSVPFQPVLVATGGHLVAVGGERRDSAAAAPVALSSNGNKIT